MYTLLVCVLGIASLYLQPCQHIGQFHVVQRLAPLHINRLVRARLVKTSEDRIGKVWKKRNNNFCEACKMA